MILETDCKDNEAQAEVSCKNFEKLYFYANMCIMTTQNGTDIKQILSESPSGTVLTAKYLNSLGVSYSLMRSYEHSLWLKRISNGAYTKLNEEADISGAIYALQNDGLQVHEGAQSALKDFYSKMHFAKNENVIHLFAPAGTKLPAWFKNVYCGQYSLHLTSFLPDEIGMTERKETSFSVQIPALERALLELLYLVPEKVTVQEAYSITETVVSVKTPLMQNLLENCNSVKVKRLLLCFAENAGLQWFDALDVQKISLGSGVRSLEKGGRLYEKYGLVLPELE